MPFFSQHQDKNLSVSVWRMDESVEELFPLLGSQSSWLRNEADAKFSSEYRKREWLSVRALLVSQLGDDVTIAYRKNGEPYLIGSPMKISISHTKNYVAIALHPNCFAGVDIETFSDRVISVESRIATCAEFPSQPMTAAERTWYDLVLWSAKESLYKALDISFLDYTNQMMARPFPLNEQGHLYVDLHQCNYVYPFCVRYLRTEEFVLTWCLSAPLM